METNNARRIGEGKNMIAVIALFLAVTVVPIGGAIAPEAAPDIEPFNRPVPPPHPVPWRYAEALYLECQAEGVPLWIAARLFARESGFCPTAQNINPNGTIDQGIAQLNSRYLDFFEGFNDGQPIDPLDGPTSIRVGVRYLSALYRATGEWEDAVAAYNCGLGR
jgi:hypothetical protein